MKEFKKYSTTAIGEMRPYKKGEDLTGVFISSEDIKKGSPKVGDMIARDPYNHEDEWLIAWKYFRENFQEI